MKRQNKFKGGVGTLILDNLKAIDAVLYSLLALLFLAYFTVYGNSAFLLCSFLLFLALVPILLLKTRYVEYSVLLGIVLIVSGSLIHYLFPLMLAAYTVAAFALGATFLYAQFEDRGLKSLVFAAGALPILLWGIGAAGFPAFSENVAIAGYYLLIVSVISLFVSAAYENSEMRSDLPERIREYFGRNVGIVHLVLALAALALLVLPIWFTGTTIKAANPSYSALPYVPLSIMNFYNAPGNHTLTFNASFYQRYENSNLSNIRFYSPDGSAIRAAIMANGSYTSPMATVLLSNPAGVGNSILLKFFPKNVSFDGYLSPAANAVAASDAVPLTVGFGSISGGYNYTKVTFNSIEYMNLEKTADSKGAAYPYYQLDSLCPAGTDRKGNLSITSNVVSSLFMLGDMGNFSSAVVGVNMSNPYFSYISHFQGKSTRYELNRRNFSFNYSFSRDSTSCIYYVVVFNRTAELDTRTTYSYYANTMVNITRYEPEVPAGSRYINFNTGFLPQGLAYLWNRYQQGILNATKQ